MQMVRSHCNANKVCLLPSGVKMASWFRKGRDEILQTHHLARNFELPEGRVTSNAVKIFHTEKGYMFLEGINPCMTCILQSEIIWLGLKGILVFRW